MFIQKCINWLNTEKVWNIVFQKSVTIKHAYCAEILIRMCEVCVQNGLNFATTGPSTMTTLQFTGCCHSFYGGRGGPSVELEHHPDSAILLPVTFWLFPKLKSTCQWWRFLEIKDFRNMWQQYWNFSERVPLMFSYEHSYLSGLLRRWPMSLSCNHTETFAIKSCPFSYWKKKKRSLLSLSEICSKVPLIGTAATTVYLPTHNLPPISS
jgi:hypothetical protein